MPLARPTTRWRPSGLKAAHCGSPMAQEIKDPHSLPRRHDVPEPHRAVKRGRGHLSPARVEGQAKDGFGMAGQGPQRFRLQVPGGARRSPWCRRPAAGVRPSGLKARVVTAAPPGTPAAAGLSPRPAVGPWHRCRPTPAIARRG